MAGRQWYLFSVHGLVLLTLVRHGDLTVTDIASRVGRTKWTVLRVLRDLREADLLATTRVGRRNTYRVNREAQFRNPVLRDEKIGVLFEALAELGSERPLASRQSGR